MSETENKVESQKLKTSKLAIISLFFVVISFIILPFRLIVYRPEYIEVSGWNIVRHFALFALPFSIFTLFYVKIHKNKLKGKFFALIGTIFAACVLFLFLLEKINRGGDYFYRCGSYINGLGKAMKLYTMDDGRYPEPNQWCDLLVTCCAVNSKLFISHPSSISNIWIYYFSQIYPRPNPQQRKSNYAMNPNCEPNSPADMVLLFETKIGWNQAGGPEILNIENHNGEGCSILFNDGHVEFIKTEKLKGLKWKVEETHSNITEWSEGKAYMGTIAIAIRAYIADLKPNLKPPADNDFVVIGFMTNDLFGRYFKPEMFSFKVTNLKPLKYIITATNYDLTPVEMTLDQDGNWTEVRLRK